MSIQSINYDNMDPWLSRNLKKAVLASVSRDVSNISYDDDMFDVMKAMRNIANRMRRGKIVSENSKIHHDVNIIFMSRSVKDVRQVDDQNKMMLMTTICVFSVKNDVFQASMCHSATMPITFDMHDPRNSKKTLVSETETVVYSYKHGDEIDAGEFFPKRNVAPKTDRRYLDAMLVFQFNKSDVRVEEYLDIIAEHNDVRSGPSRRRLR
jgi:hypothetical protein